MHKFVRSPINGAIGGLIVSLHTGGLRFVVLGAIAWERFPEWMTRRRIFVLPYVFTWLLFVGLWVASR